MYDRILLPTDGSAGMDDVIGHVDSLATVHDADVHALYVVDTESLTGIPMDASFEGLNQTLREEGETALRETERLLSDASVDTTLREGSPASEIVDYATEVDADLVVMGTHGRSGVDRILLGSVAERVVRSSPVPVLTVRVEDGVVARE